MNVHCYTFLLKKNIKCRMVVRVVTCTEILVVRVITCTTGKRQCEQAELMLRRTKRI